MTIRELIEELTDLADEHGDDAEVRLAFQPRWPLEYTVGRDVVAVTFAAPLDADYVDDAEDSDDAVADEDHAGTIVYLGEGRQVGYLPGVAATELGWSK